MINMVMNDDTWHLIKKIKRVSNFWEQEINQLL